MSDQTNIEIAKNNLNDLGFDEIAISQVPSFIEDLLSVWSKRLFRSDIEMKSRFYKTIGTYFLLKGFELRSTSTTSEESGTLYHTIPGNNNNPLIIAISRDLNLLKK